MTHKHEHTMKELRKIGEYDYDYLEDVLFFKVKNREYEKSIETENFVLDIDKEGFIVGIQIFEASKFFRIPKISLRDVKKWELIAIIENKIIELRLSFQAVIRSKVIQPQPIIIKEMDHPLPNSKVVCIVS